MPSSRLEYLRNCTQEEREDEGTESEYEELEAQQDLLGREQVVSNMMFIRAMINHVESVEYLMRYKSNDCDIKEVSLMRAAARSGQVFKAFKNYFMVGKPVFVVDAKYLINGKEHISKSIVNAESSEKSADDIRKKILNIHHSNNALRNSSIEINEVSVNPLNLSATAIQSFATKLETLIPGSYESVWDSETFTSHAYFDLETGEVDAIETHNLSDDKDTLIRESFTATVDSDRFNIHEMNDPEDEDVKKLRVHIMRIKSLNLYFHNPSEERKRRPSV